MRKALDEILERIRESYIEINLHKTNAKAWKDYIDFQKEVREPPVRKSGKGTRRKRKG